VAVVPKPIGPSFTHYSDQLAAWNAGEYHVLPLNRKERVQRVERLQLRSPG
jgi:hypothetical protein